MVNIDDKILGMDLLEEDDNQLTKLDEPIETDENSLIGTVVKKVVVPVVIGAVTGFIVYTGKKIMDANSNRPKKRGLFGLFSKGENEYDADVITVVDPKVVEDED